MPFIYSRAFLKSRINAGIQGRIGMLIDADETCNEAVREVMNDHDLRSARRKAALAPNLFNGEYEYSVPADMASSSIIDIPEQAKREDGSFFMVPTEQFYVLRRRGMIAFDTFNGASLILINSNVDSKTAVVSEMDDLNSGGGTWLTYGDATNLQVDSDDFMMGNASLSFDLNAAGGTTAGLYNAGLNAFDLTDYLGGESAIFVHAKINNTTGLTNYILQIGDDASNYYQKTVTVRNDGTVFQAGWNLLRFDLASLTTVGAPSKTSTKFVRLYMTKLGTKISESSYKFDYIVLKRGKNADLKYYSKYGWNDSTGAWKESSTVDSDLVVADTDEINLFIKKGRALASREVAEIQANNQDADASYKAAIDKYKMDNPSEVKIMTNEYYNYDNFSATFPDNPRN